MATKKKTTKTTVETETEQTVAEQSTETTVTEETVPEVVEKTKDFAIFDWETGKFLQKVTLKYTTEEPPEEWARCETMTEVLPDQSMMDAYENGYGTPIYTKENKVWTLEEPDAEQLQQYIDDAIVRVDNVVSDKIRNGTIEYNGKNVYYNRRKCHEYQELYVLTFTGVFDLPQKIKAAKTDECVEFTTLEEFKNFVKFIYNTKMKIVEIGRVIKYGGTLAGIEVKPLQDYTMEEICQFKASESVEMFLDMLDQM